MEWFKVYARGILRGSLATSPVMVQLIWFKLLAVQSETRTRDGWLHYAPGKPMTHEFLATACNVTIEDFRNALREFMDDIDKDGHPRIKVNPDDGDIYLVNWEFYQARPMDKTGIPAAELREEQMADWQKGRGGDG